jgi:hypothetical protein
MKMEGWTGKKTACKRKMARRKEAPHPSMYLIECFNGSGRGRGRVGSNVPFGFSYKTTFIGNLKTTAEALNVTLQFTLASALME